MLKLPCSQQNQNNMDSDTLATRPLGFLAKDAITGFTGVAVARTQWLNGCWRISLQPRELKDGKPIENHTFDIQQIKVLEEQPAVVEAAPVGQKRPGGPFPEPTRNADPV
jgi:hypothetical protein